MNGSILFVPQRLTNATLHRSVRQPLGLRVHCYCDACNHRHTVEGSELAVSQGLNDWRFKHSGDHCWVWFDWPERSFKSRLVDLWRNTWQIKQKSAFGKLVLTARRLFKARLIPLTPILGYLPNASVKVSYASSVAYTMTSLNSLASDTNLTAGAQSLKVDNTSNLYLDYFIAGLVKNNASSAPTAGTEIDVWVYRAYDDTPTYPDVLDGTDSTKTITTGNIKNSGMIQIKSMTVAATTSQVNPFDSGLLGQYMGNAPSLHGIFIVHNSGQSLAASGNTITSKGQYVTVA